MCIPYFVLMQFQRLNSTTVSPQYWVQTNTNTRAHSISQRKQDIVFLALEGREAAPLLGST